MLVYPAKGLRVRDPATREFVPQAGLEVHEHDLLWARLIRDGAVTPQPPAPKVDAAAPPEGETAAAHEEPA